MYDYLVRLKSTDNLFQIISEPDNGVSENSNKNFEFPNTDLPTESSIYLCLYLYFILFYKPVFLLLDENGICSNSNSSLVAAESYASNWVPIYPPTLITKLFYCLKFLVPTGEYQEVCNLFIVIYIQKYNKIYLILVFKPCI